MEWLNYHHLMYFWVVAKEGGLVPAGKVLRLSHPTLSAQVRALEHRLGEKLFHKQGRRLALTDMGKLVFRYAEEIFSTGRELLDAVKGRSLGQQLRFDVGVADSVPKPIVRRLIEPALALSESVRLVCYEDAHEKLLARLATYELDLVIADAPVPVGSRVRAYAHLLGETGVAIFAGKPQAKALRRAFPQSLDGAPMLLPLEHLPLRRALDQWFDRVGIKPKVLGEFEDSALLSAFGRDGVGAFAAPVATGEDLIRQFNVEHVGEVPGAEERYYAITVDRRLKHPATVAITASAREDVFGG